MIDNILRVTFGKETRIKSKPLYQYDYGQKIKFIDLNLPAAYQVHFSNQERGDAIPVVATTNEVEIPDSLLQTGLNIFVWVFLHTGNDDGETEYEVTIPVIRRAAVLDQEPTPEQTSAWDEAIAALNSAVTETRTGVNTVEQVKNNVTNLYHLVEADKEIVYRDKEATIAAASFLQNVSANATTLSPDDEATANYSSGIFTFGIPQGIQGIPGKKGDTGPSGITYELDSNVEIIVKNKNVSPIKFTPTTIVFKAYKTQDGIRSLYEAYKIIATIYGSGYTPVVESTKSSILTLPVPSYFSDVGYISAAILDESNNILATKTVSCVLDGLNGPPGDLTYLLQPSRNIVVYDPTKVSDKRINPISITITSYQISAGVRTTYPVDEIIYNISQNNIEYSGSFVSSNKVTTGTLNLRNITTAGYITFSAINDGQIISQNSVPIIAVNEFTESITIGATTLTEANLIKLLELIEE